MSAIVSSTVPALFIVPTTAVSPSSMFRRVTRPSIGDEMITWFRLYLVVARLACSCLICCSRVWMSCCRARSSASRTVSSFCARSSASLVVSPSFHSSSCRARFSFASSSAARACSTAVRDCCSDDSRRGDAGFSALHLALERSRVDLEQELAGPDALALFDRQPRHPAHGVRRDVHLPLRLHLARRRDDGFEVPRADGFGDDFRTRVLTVHIGGPRAASDQRYRHQGDEHLLRPRHRHVTSLPPRVRSHPPSHPPPPRRSPWPPPPFAGADRWHKTAMPMPISAAHHSMKASRLPTRRAAVDASSSSGSHCPTVVALAVVSRT